LCILTWEYKNLEPDFSILFKHRTWNEQYVRWFQFFNVHTLVISDMIINSSADIDKFKARIDNFSKFLDSEKNTNLNDTIFIKQYINYYFNQMKTHNSILKKKSKHYITRKRFLTNFIYALNGYEFKNDKWKVLFECFKWYKPTTSAPVLTDEEQKMIIELKNL
jgi:hypothetical protein